MERTLARTAALALGAALAAACGSRASQEDTVSHDPDPASAPSRGAHSCPAPRAGLADVAASAGAPAPVREAPHTATFAVG